MDIDTNCAGIIVFRDINNYSKSKKKRKGSSALHWGFPLSIGKSDENHSPSKNQEREKILDMGKNKKIKEVEVLLVRSRKGKWGFPKGKKEKGETKLENAYREFAEETSLNQDDLEMVNAKNPVKLIEYSLQGKASVFYFLARLKKKAWDKEVYCFDPNELSGIEWCSIPDALNKLSDIKRRVSILRRALKAMNDGSDAILDSIEIKVECLIED